MLDFFSGFFLEQLVPDVKVTWFDSRQ
uniref:Uncharacterized protein n=1 Tax=Rhizophora mucronata TaxID=61149 RepID=A0A2P2IMH5_RHIMU